MGKKCKGELLNFVSTVQFCCRWQKAHLVHWWPAHAVLAGGVKKATCLFKVCTWHLSLETFICCVPLFMCVTNPPIHLSYR